MPADKWVYCYGSFKKAENVRDVSSDKTWGEVLGGRCVICGQDEIVVDEDGMLDGHDAPGMIKDA